MSRIVIGNETTADGNPFAMLEGSNGTQYFAYFNKVDDIQNGKWLCYVTNFETYDLEPLSGPGYKTPYIPLYGIDGQTMDASFKDWLIERGVPTNILP